MRKLLVSIGIGIAAGIVDVIPMIAQDLPWRADLSAFVHWVVLGVIITHVEIGLRPWLKGIVIAELAGLPIMIIVAEQGMRAAVPIAVFSAVLGCAVGWLGARYAK